MPSAGDAVSGGRLPSLRHEITGETRLRDAMASAGDDIGCKSGA